MTPTPTTLPGHQARWHARAQKHRAQADEIQRTIDRLQAQRPPAPRPIWITQADAQAAADEIELLREEMEAAIELAHYAQMRADLSRRPDGVWLAAHRFSSGVFTTLMRLHTNATALAGQSGDLVRDAEQTGNRQLLLDVWPIHVCTSAAAFDYAAIIGALGRRHVVEPDVTYPADRPWPEHAGPRPEIPVPADPDLTAAAARMQEIARAKRAQEETVPSGGLVRWADVVIAAREAVEYVVPAAESAEETAGDHDG